MPFPTYNVKFPDSLGVRILESSEPVVISGTAAPTTAPAKLGQIYLDTTAKVCYVAFGTAAVGDWIAVN